MTLFTQDTEVHTATADLPIPWDDARLCWIVQRTIDGGICQASGAAAKREARELAAAGTVRVFLAWPGRWRTMLYDVTQLLAHKAASVT